MTNQAQCEMLRFMGSLLLEAHSIKHFRVVDYYRKLATNGVLGDEGHGSEWLVGNPSFIHAIPKEELPVIRASLHPMPHGPMK